LFKPCKIVSLGPDSSACRHQAGD